MSRSVAAWTSGLVAAHLAAAMACGASSVRSATVDGILDAVPRRVVDAQTAALLLAGQAGGELEGAMTWAVVDETPAPERVTVRFVVELDGGRFLEGSSPGLVEVEVTTYLMAPDGAVLAHQAAAVALERSEVRQRARSAGLRILGELDCPLERTSLRVLVRNSGTGRFLLLRRELDLRSGPGGVATLSPPLVESPAESEGWLSIVLPGAHPTGWPSARPVWRTDRPLEVVLSGATAGELERVAAKLEDHLGHVLLEPEVVLSSDRGVGSPAGSLRAMVSPPDLPPGAYRLVLWVDDAESGRVVEEWLEVVLHDRMDLGNWTDALDLLAAVPDRGEAEPSEPEAVEPEIEAARTAYRGALEAWCRGEPIAARRAVAELERPYARDTQRSWRQLVVAEAGVLSELAVQQPAMVLGAVLLHRELYAWYLAQGEGVLARHSWESAAVLAVELEEIAEFDPPGGFAEAVLLDLASRLVEAGQMVPAGQLLDRALVIAPTSARALFAVGVLAERSGRPCDAAKSLRKLVAAHPEHEQGRLRLAVNELRCGDEKAAEGLLRDLASDRSEEWIRSIALQELARMMGRDGRVEEAIELLSAGVADLAGDQGLRVLLGHALDLHGQPHRAASVVQDLGAGSTDDEPSPRYRYSQWPRPEAAWVRQVLREAETAAREGPRVGAP